MKVWRASTRSKVIHLTPDCAYVDGRHQPYQVEKLKPAQPVCSVCRKQANGQNGFDYADEMQKQCPLCGSELSGPLPDHLPCDNDNN